MVQLSFDSENVQRKDLGVITAEVMKSVWVIYPLSDSSNISAR
jgi:hypothetical protein